MKAVSRLAKILHDSDELPESRGVDLRLDLADVVLRELNRKGWSQKNLAKATGMTESFITRIVHSDSNCTFDVAGRVLFALGLHASLVKCDDRREPVGVRIPVTAGRWVQTSAVTRTSYGKVAYTQPVIFKRGGTFSSSGQRLTVGEDAGSLVGDPRQPLAADPLGGWGSRASSGESRPALGRGDAPIHDVHA